MSSSTLPPQDDLPSRQLRSAFGPLDDAALDAIRERLQWLQLAAGETLMRQGDPGDALYLLVSGRLRVYIDEDGERRVVREIPRGEVVGEISLYTDTPRTATLVAIRDSRLVRLTKDDFQRLQAAHPLVSLAMTRQIVQRLQTEKRRRPLDRPVAMALLPISERVDLPAFAQAFAAKLAAHGRVAIVDAAVAGARRAASADDTAAVVALLDELESRHDFVLLVGEPTPSAWTGLCTRHADEILLLADATAAPRVHPSEAAFLTQRGARAEAAEILVLLQPDDGSTPQGTARWLARRPVAHHLHVRPGVAADLARLARIQARSAVGLVLSGGGARGFAHLGVYRALIEHGIDIDVVGGTSIGAVMAALVASGLPYERIEAVARAAFAEGPTGDYNLLPLMSLIKGRRLRVVVERAAAETVGAGADIEDLRLGFFCIASNFSQAREVVLRRDRLVHALLCSTAIPGALPPVLHDGDLLCDGGTFNNFPADVMREQRGVGTVIGVDLGAARRRRIELQALPGAWALLRDRLRPRRARRFRLPTLPSILMSTTILYSTSRRRQARELSDLYFDPPLERVGMLDWQRFAPIVAQGYEHARARLAEGAPFGAATHVSEP
jgi:NTE family protein